MQEYEFVYETESGFTGNITVSASCKVAAWMSFAALDPANVKAADIVNVKTAFESEL